MLLRLEGMQLPALRKAHACDVPMAVQGVSEKMHLDGGNTPDGSLVCKPECLAEAIWGVDICFWKGTPNL